MYPTRQVPSQIRKANGLRSGRKGLDTNSMDGNSQVRARIADITGSGLLLWQKELPTKRLSLTRREMGARGQDEVLLA